MTKPFTLTPLRYFAVVAELENMTAAAERLLVTQSTLSTAIAQLEKSISSQPFIRHQARGLRLTAVGRQFAHDIKPFLEQADSLYESAQGLSTTLVGDLKIGVFVPLAPIRLPGIIQAFETKYPGVQVSVLEIDLAALKDALLEGRCDVALSYRLGLDRSFSARTVDRVPPHVLVHEGHRVAAEGRQEVSLKDFDGEACIALDLPISREYYEQLFAIRTRPLVAVVICKGSCRRLRKPNTRWVCRTPASRTKTTSSGASASVSRSATILDALAERAEAVNGSINALTETLFEEARHEAKQAATKYVQGRDLTPLLGLPVATKEKHGIKGRTLSQGLTAKKAEIAQEDQSSRISATCSARPLRVKPPGRRTNWHPTPAGSSQMQGGPPKPPATLTASAPKASSRPSLHTRCRDTTR